MRPFPRRPAFHLKLIWLLLLAAAFAGEVAQAKDWWDSAWTVRKKITIDTSAKGAGISQPIGETVVLVRLHDGNFQFPLAKDDGSDIRFVAEDDKTPLAWHLERFDSLLNEAFAWVRVRDVKPDGVTSFYLYYGNQTPKPAGASDSKATYDPETTLVYHFGERSAPAADATGRGATAQNPGAAVEGALIAGGLRLTGATTVTIPASPDLAWAEGGAVTLSLWVKLTVLQPNAVLLSRREKENSFLLGADQGKPFVEIGGARAAAEEALPVNVWHHLAVTAEGGKTTLLVDGESRATLAAGLPSVNSPLTLGGDTADGATPAQGEVDELQIARVARPAGWLKFAALSQGPDKAAKLLSFAEDEQSGGGGGHSGYFMVIVNSLTLDGWIVIGLLGVMAVISWWVMFSKVSYLNGLAKGNALFMKEWKHVATDLTALDHGDPDKVKSLGGRLGDKGQRSLRNSSVYRIYHVGAEEIRHRLAAEQSKALSGRSIHAIRATLDGGLVREKQKIDRLIVLLTICISGGPFLGLLGTVVGVMITFAAVAAAGDVNVNAIAPGIAAALLATVAGLAVAIPSLFGYNYILSRVKDAVADMHVFIDEFVTKMAEFYSGTGEEPRKISPDQALTMASLLDLLKLATRSSETVHLNGDAAELSTRTP